MLHRVPRGVFALLVATVAVLPPGTVLAAGRAECRTVSSAILQRPVRYCVLLPPSYDAEKARRYPIVYYLHGLGDNEQSLVRSGGWELVEQLWEQGQIGELLLATPDGGRGFYVNSRDGKEPYEDFFIREFLPAIEKRYRAWGTRAARGIGGTSMGGYGALRFAFKYPQLFASVTAHSAALVEEMGGGTSAAFGRSFRAFGEPFDPQYWKQNTPFALAGSGNGLARLKIYFDCGLQDDYGFDAGAQALHELLQQRKIPHEFHLYSGGHSWQYVAEHFDESLAFHSVALGAKK